MSDLPERLFANPVWSALHGPHRHFALHAGHEACRYPADVAPFAAIAAPEGSALRQLRSLLAANESVWIAADALPPVDGLVLESMLDCHQMVLPPDAIVPSAQPSPAPEELLIPLSSADADDMLALIDLAFPGFYRPRTHAMGAYFGVRERGSRKLIAMGGERLKLDGYPELSGVCTHPEYRGQGHATRILWHLVRRHRRDSLVTWLHVVSTNTRAVNLYLAMGLKLARRIKLLRITRREHAPNDP